MFNGHARSWRQLSNVRAQRPKCELREHAVRWSARLGGRHLLNDLVRPQQQRLRDRDTEGLCGFEVDHEV